MDASPYAATYGGQLADHLPMALRALEAMGADAERRAAFARAYAERLEPLGEEERAARARMRESLEREGLAQSLRARLPGLMPAAAALAFHPLIRLGYAVESRDLAEAAAALVSWERHPLTVIDPAALAPPDPTISMPGRRSRRCVPTPGRRASAAAV